MFQYRSDQPQVKRNVIPSIANLVQELPHELPNDLRVRISGNIEILGKPQVWVETQRSAQTPFQKLNFGVTAKKHTEVDIQLFLSFPDLLDFSILFQMFCLGLSEQTKFWSEPCPVSFKRHFFLQFVYHQSISPNCNENIKQVRSTTLSKLMVLCKQYFAYFVWVKN